MTSPPVVQTEGDCITLAHGNGGRLMRELIENIFLRHLRNPLLDVDADAVAVPVTGAELVVTSDAFTVQPLEFPGGDIGSLAVHGTINDLAVSGAVPQYLTLGAIIEEGLELSQLERIVASLARAAHAAGVNVVCGDTKVVRRGEGGGLYLITTGLGLRDPRIRLGARQIRPGDALLVSGPVGDHGIAVMFAREQFGLRGDLQSDAASVLPLAQALLPLAGLRFMRDPTRGGLAMIANEIVRSTGLSVRLSAAAIPVRDAVVSVCEMLGYDPLYLACEGRILAVIAAGEAEKALALWQALPQGLEARIIGTIGSSRPQVVLETDLGGERVLQELEEDPLPRIC